MRAAAAEALRSLAWDQASKNRVHLHPQGSNNGQSQEVSALTPSSDTYFPMAGKWFQPFPDQADGGILELHSNASEPWLDVKIAPGQPQHCPRRASRSKARQET